MPTTSLDFGLFIAYLIPGLVTLWALSYPIGSLRQLFSRLDDEKRFGPIIAVASLALVTGMVVSIVRAGVLDHTFEIPYPLLDCNGDPQFGNVGRVDPDYTRFTDEGYREAFLLAVAHEKRLYQFYGNTLLAILLVSFAWLSQGNWRSSTRRFRIAAPIAVVCAVIALYGGARMSHYRFMRAVTMLNGQTFAALDAEGRPCRETNRNVVVNSRPQ
jgi:hypothetical protein